MKYYEAQLDDGSDLGGGDLGDSDPDTWREALPSEVKAWDEAKNADTADKFWSQISAHREMLGRSIKIPSQEASDEMKAQARDKVLEHYRSEVMRIPDGNDADAMADVYKALGQPEESGGYSLPDLEAPEGIQGLDEESANAVKDIFHKHGASQKQYEGIYGELAKIDIQRQVAAMDAVKASDTELRTNWGAAYDQNMAVTVHYLQQMKFDDNTIAAVRDGRMQPGNVAAFYSMAKQSGEGMHVSGQEGSSDIMTPDEAQQTMDDIFKKVQAGKRDGSMGVDEQRALLKKRNSYRQFAYPGD